MGWRHIWLVRIWKTSITFFLEWDSRLHKSVSKLERAREYHQYKPSYFQDADLVYSRGEAVRWPIFMVHLCCKEQTKPLPIYFLMHILRKIILEHFWNAAPCPPHISWTNSTDMNFVFKCNVVNLGMEVLMVFWVCFFWGWFFFLNTCAVLLHLSLDTILHRLSP